MVAAGLPRLPRLKPSRSVRFTNWFTEPVHDLRVSSPLDVSGHAYSSPVAQWLLFPRLWLMPAWSGSPYGGVVMGCRSDRSRFALTARASCSARHCFSLCGVEIGLCALGADAQRVAGLFQGGDGGVVTAVNWSSERWWSGRADASAAAASVSSARVMVAVSGGVLSGLVPST